MSYVRAEDILPEELITAIQQYVSGRSIYIPCKEKRAGAARQKRGNIIKVEMPRSTGSISAAFA